jgi:hypothetical protein
VTILVHNSQVSLQACNLLPSTSAEDFPFAHILEGGQEIASHAGDTPLARIQSLTASDFAGSHPEVVLYLTIANEVCIDSGPHTESEDQWPQIIQNLLAAARFINLSILR